MGFLRDIYRRVTGRRTKARYDAAQTTSRNAEHWKWADSFNADQSNSPEVRERLRNRARYEVANNPWLSGLIFQVASDLIGVMPRLQINSVDEKFSGRIEADFRDWAEAVNLGELLRVAYITKMRDGEAFIQLTTCKDLASPIKLFPMLIDAERVKSPRDDTDTDDDQQADGVYFDRFGRPVAYSISKVHPAVNGTGECTKVKAAYVIHLYRQERPEQHRGIPEITSALPSIAILRAYTKAMLEKMENSASVAGVLKPTSMDLEPDELTNAPFTEFNLPSRSWVTLPLGYDMQQYQLNNPTDSQQSFALQTKIECARCLLGTRNIVTGDSTSYTYASARVDAQNYDRSQRVERGKIEHDCLNRLFSAWWTEYAPGKSEPEHSWYFNGRPPIDPAKDANCEKRLLTNGTLTLADACAQQGKDWQQVTRQRFAEAAFIRKLEKEYGIRLDEIDSFTEGEAKRPSQGEAEEDEARTENTENE
ncbi:MAG: phage portal protein [Victivallales bacterium]|nr:phage portal protein [Victivallales bacterium]